MKKSFTLVLACGCFAGMLQPAVAQQTTAAPKPGIRGVLDPATGVFTATPAAAMSDEDAALAAASIVPTTGKYLVNFTIKLVTPLPSGDYVLCEVAASVFDSSSSGGGNSVRETASTKATISGSTATCHVSIPYSWYLVNAKTDTVTMTYDIYMLSTSSVTTGLGSRSTSQYVVPGGVLKVPTNGATTTYNVSATM